jgi:hypothetical protein
MGFFSLIVFIIILTILMFVWGIITVIYKYVEKKWFKKQLIPTRYKRNFRITLFILIILYSGFETYQAYYPSMRFYIKEWQFFTSMELPKNVKILSRAADYPDFHGDFSSSAIFKVSNQDYLRIKSRFMKDTTYSDIKHSGGETLNIVLEKCDYDFYNFNNCRGKWNSSEVHFVKFKDDENLILFYGFHD